MTWRVWIFNPVEFLLTAVMRIGHPVGPLQSPAGSEKAEIRGALQVSRGGSPDVSLTTASADVVPNRTWKA